MSTLKIQVSGSAEVVEVPCRLPRFFSFWAWLPERGITKVEAELTSTDPSKAAMDLTFCPVEAGDEALAGPEQHHAARAAGVVWAEIRRRLGMVGAVATNSALAAIAKAYKAERALEAALTALHALMPSVNAAVGGTCQNALVEYTDEVFAWALNGSYAHAESVRDESETTAKEEARMAVEP